MTKLPYIKSLWPSYLPSWGSASPAPPWCRSKVQLFSAWTFRRTHSNHGTKLLSRESRCHLLPVPHCCILVPWRRPMNSPRSKAEDWQNSFLQRTRWEIFSALRPDGLCHCDSVAWKRIQTLCKWTWLCSNNTLLKNRWQTRCISLWRSLSQGLIGIARLFLMTLSSIFPKHFIVWYFLCNIVIDQMWFNIILKFRMVKAIRILCYTLVSRKLSKASWFLTLVPNWSLS